jgi:hypothetical protein
MQSRKACKCPPAPCHRVYCLYSMPSVRAHSFQPCSQAFRDVSVCPTQQCYCYVYLPLVVQIMRGFAGSARNLVMEDSSALTESATRARRLHRAGSARRYSWSHEARICLASPVRVGSLFTISFATYHRWPLSLVHVPLLRVYYTSLLVESVVQSLSGMTPSICLT